MFNEIFDIVQEHGPFLLVCIGLLTLHGVLAWRE